MEVPLDKPGSGNDSPRQKVLTKKRSRKHNESDSEAEEEKETKRGKYRVTSLEQLRLAEFSGE